VEVSDILIATDVPIHWIHTRDLYPSFFPRRWAPPACGCGEPSLFHQRAKGWDVSRHRFFFKYLRMVFACQRLSYRGLFARVVALHDAALILNDWVSFFYTIVILIIMPDRIVVFQGLLGAWAFQVRVPYVPRSPPFPPLNACPSLSAQMIAYSLFNFVVLRPKGLDVGSEVIVLFPIIYKLPCILILRFYAMLYNVLYYVPCVRNKVRPPRRVVRVRRARVADARAPRRRWYASVFGRGTAGRWTMCCPCPIRGTLHATRARPSGSSARPSSPPKTARAPTVLAPSAAAPWALASDRPRFWARLCPFPPSGPRRHLHLHPRPPTSPASWSTAARRTCARARTWYPQSLFRPHTDRQTDMGPNPPPSPLHA
jgi:hypothetical protein